MTALLLGGIAAYSHNTGRSATDNLSSFAIDKTLGIPNTVFVALTFIVAFWFILSRTTGGRRFTAVSTSAQAGRAAGLRVDRYTVTTYVLAAMCYATAGILLAGFVRTPALDIGNPYLLATITAVVIGGTPLGGGRGSVIETALAALFLTQLTAFTDALSAPVDDPARAGRRDRGRRTRPERGRRRRRAPRNCLPAETKTCIKALR